VLHRPTGETWTVAYVDGDRMSWCGWPPGEAMVSDCDLIERASDALHLDILRQCSEMQDRGDKRCVMARREMAHA
jgi:hypothetical protein